MRCGACGATIARCTGWESVYNGLLLPAFGVVGFGLHWTVGTGAAVLGVVAVFALYLYLQTSRVTYRLEEPAGAEGDRPDRG